MLKNDVKVRVGKMKIKTWFLCFFKCSLNFRAHDLQSELSKVNISNFVKFRLQSMTSKIERAFEKTNIIFHQNRAKKKRQDTARNGKNRQKIERSGKKQQETARTGKNRHKRQDTAKNSKTRQDKAINGMKRQIRQETGRNRKNREETGRTKEKQEEEEDY